MTIPFLSLIFSPPQASQEFNIFGNKKLEVDCEAPSEKYNNIEIIFSKINLTFIINGIILGIKVNIIMKDIAKGLNLYGSDFLLRRMLLIAMMEQIIMNK